MEAGGGQPVLDEARPVTRSSGRHTRTPLQFHPDLRRITAYRRAPHGVSALTAGTLISGASSPTRQPSGKGAPAWAPRPRPRSPDGPARRGVRIRGFDQPCLCREPAEAPDFPQLQYTTSSSTDALSSISSRGATGTRSLPYYSPTSTVNGSRDEGRPRRAPRFKDPKPPALRVDTPQGHAQMLEVTGCPIGRRG